MSTPDPRHLWTRLVGLMRDWEFITAAEAKATGRLPFIKRIPRVSTDHPGPSTPAVPIITTPERTRNTPLGGPLNTTMANFHRVGYGTASPQVLESLGKEYVSNESFRDQVHLDLKRTSERGDFDKKIYLIDFFAITFIHTHRNHYLRFTEVAAVVQSQDWEKIFDSIMRNDQAPQHHRLFQDRISTDAQFRRAMCSIQSVYRELLSESGKHQSMLLERQLVIGGAKAQLRSTRHAQIGRYLATPNTPVFPFEANGAYLISHAPPWIRDQFDESQRAFRHVFLPIVDHIADGTAEAAHQKLFHHALNTFGMFRLQIEKRVKTFRELSCLASLEKLNRILDAIKMAVRLDEDMFVHQPGGVYWEPNNLAGELLNLVAEQNETEWTQKMFVDQLKSDSSFTKQVAQRINEYRALNASTKMTSLREALDRAQANNLNTELSQRLDAQIIDSDQGKAAARPDRRRGRVSDWRSESSVESLDARNLAKGSPISSSTSTPSASRRGPGGGSSNSSKGSTPPSDYASARSTSSR